MCKISNDSFSSCGNILSMLYLAKAFMAVHTGDIPFGQLLFIMHTHAFHPPLQSENDKYPDMPQRISLVPRETHRL